MSDIMKFSPLWGEWEIDSKLGEGSFGAVWKIRRKLIDGRIYYAAVKHISIPKDEGEFQHLIDEGIFTDRESAVEYYRHMLQSLMDEIDTMHTLQGYTNIVSYEDHKVVPKEGDLGYDLFLRMELLTPLTVRMREKMTVADVVRLGRDIATAIEVLNRHHLVHRDIKPQNIFVNSTGDYKLGDYGTARAMESAVTAMSRKGTYNYMAPEIYRNQPADSRVDIYSLGLVMYRMVNGNRLPFLPETGSVTIEQSEGAILKRISGEELPAPRYADPELARIILKACAYRAEDRYGSATELKRDLENYGGGDTAVRQGQEDSSGSGSYRFQFGSSAQSASKSGERTRRSAQKPPIGGGNASAPQDEQTVTEEEEKQERSRSRSVSGAGAVSAPKKRKTGKPLLITLVIVLAGLIAGGILLLTRPQPQPQPPVPTETAVITEKPAEAETESAEGITEQPTDPPTPATTEPPTPEPTDPPTPEPTDTPEPTPTRKPDEYYPNGKLKVAYTYDLQGHLQKTTRYNRYGKATSTVTVTEKDSRGNALTEERRYSGNSGKYSCYTYTYSYDDRGNCIKSSYVYADGTPNEYYWTYEYDDHDREILTTTYNADGSTDSYTRVTYESDQGERRAETTHYHADGTLESYTADYRYDEEDHVLGYTVRNAEKQVTSVYEAVWKNGIKTEETTRDGEGNITDHTTYDPEYGDVLTSEYTYDESRYEQSYTYFEDHYLGDWQSYSPNYSFRHISTYDTQGIEIKEENYSLREGTEEWVYESTTTKSKDAAGNRVEDTVDADGSKFHAEYDQNDNCIYSVSYEANGSFRYGSRYEYDSQGRQIRSTRLNENQQVESTYEYEYDEHGNQTKYICYEANGAFSYGYSYEYDSNGNRIRESQLSDRNKVDSYTEYTYDQNGNRIRADEYYANGKKKGHRVYDEQGNATESVSYNEDGSLSYGYSTVYDNNGNRIRMNRLTENGGIESYTLYTYDESGNRIREDDFYGNGQKKGYSEYNERGNVTKNVYYKEDGSYYFGYSYEYDSSGNEIRQNRLTENGTVESYEIKSYDQNGNRVRTDSYDGNGQLKDYTVYEYDSSGFRTHYTDYRADGTKSWETYYRKLEDGTTQSRSISYNSDGTVRNDMGWK